MPSESNDAGYERSGDGRVSRCVVVAGSRSISDYSVVESILNDYVTFEIGGVSDIYTVISGAADGVDSLGERWADERDITVQRIPADWNGHGANAGPMRNKDMAAVGDDLVAIWDGESTGTRHMIETALGERLNTHVYVPESDGDRVDIHVGIDATDAEAVERATEALDAGVELHVYVHDRDASLSRYL